MASNYEKLDLQKLKHDIPRYANSGVSAVEQQWWKGMIDMLEMQQDTSLSVDESWQLEELLQLKRTLAAGHTNVYQSTEAPTLLRTMVSVEASDIPQVCICIHVHYI